MTHPFYRIHRPYEAMKKILSAAPHGVAKEALLLDESAKNTIEPWNTIRSSRWFYGDFMILLRFYSDFMIFVCDLFMVISLWFYGDFMILCWFPCDFMFFFMILWWFHCDVLLVILFYDMLQWLYGDFMVILVLLKSWYSEWRI